MQDRRRTVNTGCAVAEQVLDGDGIALSLVAMAVPAGRPAVSIGSVDAGHLRDHR